MQIRIQDFWQKNAIFFSILLMLATIFISRAAFSITTILFVAVCLLNKNFLQQLKQSWRDPVLIAMSFLFLIPLVSGIWSSDRTEWLNLLRVKLPLLLFPLAFAGSWQLSRQQWKIVVVLILFSSLLSTSYSVVSYLTDQAAVNETYLQAKVISTPFQNDHLRFSLFICIAFLCCLYLVENGYKALRPIGAVLGLWFAIYLHVLSARTGLLCLYFISFCWLLHAIFKKGNSSYKFAMIIGIIALPVIAWFCFPTFQNRIRYFAYDHSFARRDTYLPGSTDGNRISSMKAGWNTLVEHPFGVGAGDIRAVSYQWYDKHVPNMVETDKLYPSSEWLMYGGMAGWLGIIAFTIIMVLPFFIPVKHRFFWHMLNAVIAISLIFDTGLGVQYGVFIYAFFILAFRKWQSDSIPVADHF